MQRPWPPTGLTTTGWRLVPALLLPIDSLEPVQRTRWEAVQERIAHPARSWCGDPLPHVVEYEGCWWIEDGHHRIAAAAARGESHVWVRVWPVRPS
jgi:hypothetical protein